MELLVR
jgi:hypothetical protein